MNAIGEQISAILWNVFNRPRLIDLIDILLLTIIIYELLVHVRQTRVSQTIKGYHHFADCDMAQRRARHAHHPRAAGVDD